jgi:ADP-ribose pyrophosphatase YjhB (NUDIX family)
MAKMWDENKMTLSSSFNRAVKGLSRVDAPVEEKALILSTVGRSLQSAVLYLYFQEHRGEAVDPRGAGLSVDSTRRLVKLFELRGLVERAGRRRGVNRQLREVWRLT